jgi:hypothetical protein
MNPAPPSLAPPLNRSLNRRLAVVFGLLALAGCVVLYYFNPAKYHIYPVCQFHQLTGLHCPGCGATRALYALLHADLITALHDNALFVALLMAAGLRGGWFAVNRWRGRPNGQFFPARHLVPVVVIIIAFGVLRNVPVFSFLAPLPG